MNQNEGYSILLDGESVPYSVRRSRRSKRIRMTIGDEGKLVVTIPLRGRLKDIPPVLEDHKRWILRKLTESREKKQQPPPFELENGASLPVLDYAYTLQLGHTDRKRASWHFKAKHLTITAPVFTPALIYRGVELWYRRMARLFLEDRVPHWARQMDVSPHSIRVKNQRTLWGSCSKKANLNFNWRVLLLSPEAADYLIIHELAHLKELNHSPIFWRLVGEFCPDFKAYKKELRQKDAWLKFPPQR
jgi:predicted metal-dependent hydrolase